MVSLLVVAGPDCRVALAALPWLAREVRPKPESDACCGLLPRSLLSMQLKIQFTPSGSVSVSNFAIHTLSCSDVAAYGKCVEPLHSVRRVAEVATRANFPSGRHSDVGERFRTVGN
jgi:hypothetical protein